MGAQPLREMHGDLRVHDVIGKAARGGQDDEDPPEDHDAFQKDGRKLAQLHVPVHHHFQQDRVDHGNRPGLHERGDSLQEQHEDEEGEKDLPQCAPQRRQHLAQVQGGAGHAVAAGSPDHEGAGQNPADEHVLDVRH